MDMLPYEVAVARCLSERRYAWIEQAAKHFRHPLSIAACKLYDFFKKASLEYIINKYDGGKILNEVLTILHRAVPPEEQEFMATALQRLEQRGELRGIQKERQSTAKNLLKAGIDFNIVKQPSLGKGN